MQGLNVYTLGLCAASVGLYVLVRLWKRPSLKHLPGPRGWPLLGNVLQLTKGRSRSKYWDVELTSNSQYILQRHLRHGLTSRFEAGEIETLTIVKFIKWSYGFTHY